MSIFLVSKRFHRVSSKWNCQNKISLHYGGCEGSTLMVCFELIYGANSKEMDAKHGLTNPKRRKEFYI